MAIGDKYGALMDFDKGKPNEVATLDETGILSQSQRPDAGGLYMDSSAEEPVTVKGRVEEQGKKLGEVSRPNLLLNWDFRNPVNRNGESEYLLTDYRYLIDKWWSGPCAATIDQDGLVIVGNHSTYNSVLRQPIEKPHLFAGKRVTFSVLVEVPSGMAGSIALIKSSGINSGMVGFGAVHFSQSGLYQSTVVIPDDVGGDAYPLLLAAINTNIGTEARYIAAKLELGDTQTLARQLEDGTWELIDPPNYDLQYLLTSQYSPITGEYVGSQHSNPNLLDNWLFTADSLIDQKQGYVVPPDTVYYSDTSLTTQAGTISAYTTAGYVNTTYGTVTVDNTTCYVAYADMVRGYVGAGYTVDRWKFTNASGSCIIGDDSSHLYSASAAAYFRQQLEKKMPKGTYSVSLLLHGSCTGYLGMYDSSNLSTSIAGKAFAVNGEGWELVTISGELSANFDVVTLRLDAGNTLDIKAAKLELGSVQTLAHQDASGNWVLNDPPPNKQQELAKCQRYQLAATGSVTGLSRIRASLIQANRIDFLIPTPVPLRAIPTIAINNLIVLLLSTGSAQPGFTFSVAAVSELGIMIHATKTAHGLTDATLQCAEASSITLFDANL